MARRYGRRYNNRRGSEKQFERSAYALILGMLLVTLLLPDVRPDIIMLVAGAILTGSAFYQSSRRWQVNPFTWVGGLLMLILGFLWWEKPTLIPGGIAFPLLVVGAVLVISVFNGDL